MSPRQARVQRIRDRNWRRYVRHFGNHPCRYQPCPISSDANLRDALLAVDQVRSEPSQLGLFA